MAVDQADRFGWDEDRRGEPRLGAPASAVLLVAGEEVGRYAVDNLSIDGALITGEVALRRGERIQLLLQVGRAHPIEVDARVVHRQSTPAHDCALGVTFEHTSAATEDSLREALLGSPVDVPGELLPELWDVDDPDIVALVPPPPR